jgi:glycine cleavage system H lipoate-binding protein
MPPENKRRSIMTKVQTGQANKKLPAVFDMKGNQCLWAQIGAVAPRVCNNAFDCLSCSFDKVMQRKKVPSKSRWTKERWLATPASERYCRHMLSGRVSFKLCDRLYECANCRYDQAIDAEVEACPDQEPELGSAGGFSFAPNYYYHPGHLWARVEYGGRVRIGLDDFGARVFGPSKGFDLPLIGANVSLGGVSCALRRDDRQAGLTDPLSGIVVARNPKALERGSDAISSPYGQGWLLLLEPAKLQQDLGRMIPANSASSWFEKESQRLSDMLTADTGQRLAATGGRVLPDVYGSVPGLDWDKLVKEFLRP